MLTELRVENLLLIECAQLRLAPGLNVLTGETGAGKTVLAHALDLLLGGRAKPAIVRPGAAEAYVEGVFELPDALRGELGERLPAGAEELVLARRIGADGRTRALVNGRSATVGDLRELGAAALGAAEAAGADEGGVATLLAAAGRGLAAADGIDPALDALAERWRGLGVELTELARELRDYADDLEAEPGRLDAVEERLA